MTNKKNNKLNLALHLMKEQIIEIVEIFFTEEESLQKTGCLLALSSDIIIDLIKTNQTKNSSHLKKLISITVDEINNHNGENQNDN